MRKIKASAIVQDLTIYPRCAVDKGHVAQLVNVLDAGGELPPLVICRKTRKLVDGFHRIRATVEQFGDDAEVEVIEKDYASPREMWLDSIRYNAKHGLPLSRSDQEHCKLTCKRMGVDGKELALTLGVRAEAIGVLTISRPAAVLETKPALTAKPAYQSGKGNSAPPERKGFTQQVNDIPRAANGSPPAPLSHDWLNDTPAYETCSQGMPAEEAAAVANRVMLHLHRGSIDLAREALEDGWRSHLKEQEPLPVGRELLDEPLSRVIDDLRLLNTLEGQGISTIGDLLGTGEAEWLAIPNFGTVAATKLRNLSAGLRIRAADREGEPASEMEDAAA